MTRIAGLHTCQPIDRCHSGVPRDVLKRGTSFLQSVQAESGVKVPKTMGVASHQLAQQKVKQPMTYPDCLWDSVLQIVEGCVVVFDHRLVDVDVAANDLVNSVEPAAVLAPGIVVVL
jgi:hypothetical protein